jgi:hypothetical protein
MSYPKRMFSDSSTSTRIPLAISSSRSSGSCRSSAALLLRRGFSTVAAAMSSSNIHRTRSISWMAESVMIISVVKPYGGTDGFRCAQCISSGAPIDPPSTAAFTAWYAASYRRMKPTITSRRPLATSASTIRRQASCVVASGFSQNTGFPASIDASTYSSCVGPHEVTITASTVSSLISSCPVACTAQPGNPSAICCARAGSTSVTATTCAPDSTWVSRRM